LGNVLARGDETHHRYFRRARQQIGPAYAPRDRRNGARAMRAHRSDPSGDAQQALSSSARRRVPSHRRAARVDRSHAFPMTLRVKVIPRSAKSEIVGEMADGTLKV